MLSSAVSLSSSSSSDQNSENSYTCKKCNQKMESTSSNSCLRTPRVLPCLHTFCESCLVDLGNNSDGEISCPNCENKCKTSVHELPRNYDLMKKIELLSIHSNLTYCDNCDENVLAEYQCTDCLEVLLLCETHKSIHLKKKPNHSVISLNDPKFENHLNPNLFSVKCDRKGHEKDEIDFYCESCDKLICVRCVVIDHKSPQHNFYELKEVAKRYKSSTDELLRQTNSKFPIIDDSITQIKRIISELEPKFKKIENEIKEESKKLVKSIKEREERLIQQLSEIKKEKKMKLENQLKLFEKNRNNFQNTCEFTKSTLNGIKENDNNDNSQDKTGELQFVLFKKSMTERLNEACKFTNENLEICENSELELIYDNNNLRLSDLIKSIKEIGTVVGYSKFTPFAQNCVIENKNKNENNQMKVEIENVIEIQFYNQKRKKNYLFK